MDPNTSVAPVSWIDLSTLSVGTKVVLTGQMIWRRDYTEREVIVLGVRDITGTVVVSLNLNQEPLLADIKKFSRLRIYGVLELNQKGKPIIGQITHLEKLGTLNVPYSQLDSELREYASRMLLSRIASIGAAILRDNHFIEFDAKVISTEWVDGGLEPLQVLYPGFGNPATLAASPSAQVMDFLNATGVSKAFTVSTSFTTTYRHPNNAAETRVITARGIDLTLQGLQSLVWDIARRIIERLGVEHKEADTPLVLNRPWPDKSCSAADRPSIYLFEYSGGIPTGGLGWRGTSLEHVIHVTNVEKNILIEGSFETIGERNVCGITIFPSQFLSFIEAAPPMRQLRHLGSYNDWVQ